MSEKRICKDCKHWHKADYEPGQVTVVDEEKKPGDCREGPPAVILGPRGFMVMYPRLLPTFTACDRFSQREEK